MSISRRETLVAGLGLAAGCIAGRALSAIAAEASMKIPIGVQLYALRGEFEKDVPNTLKSVAGMGYKAVEFWGYGGTPNIFQQYSAKQLRQLLDDNGLKCCGIHLQVKALEDAQIARTIENNQILGNQFLNVAAAAERMKTEELIKGFAAFLNAGNEKCRPQNMKVGYHAHPFDFVKIGGKFAWEILFSQLDPSLTMQMDMANCLAGGGDPIAMLEKFRGRATTVHLRETGEKTFDSKFYADVFKLCETTGKTQWYIVEQGGDGGKGFDVPKQALEKLRKIGK